MLRPLGRLNTFFDELRRRHVFRVAVVYLVTGWIVIQVAEVVLPALALPAWTVTFVVVLVLLGAPMAIGLAWAYDITPTGVTRTPSRTSDRDRPEPRELAGEGADEPGHAAHAAPGAAPENAGQASPPGPPAHAASPAAPGDAARSDPADERRRLIVLPFRMLRADADAEFLAFGLPDAITSSLSTLSSLVVRSHLAALRFARETPDLGEIAERAHVDIVVTGTIACVGSRVRVTAELTDARDGTLLWSEERDSEMDDLFRLQDDLTRSIVASLRVRLSDREDRLLETSAPATARAYETYLRANRVAYELGQWQDARDLYLRSVEEDPGFAHAWARLGRCYRLIAKYGSTPEEDEENLARARNAFERALSLDPQLPLAHNLYAQLEVDLGRTEPALRRLLALLDPADPDPEPYAGLVHACRFAGLLDESVAAHAAAHRIDPTVSTSVNHTYWMLGEYQRAYDATIGGGIGYLPGLALASLGRTGEAIDILRRHEAEQHDERPRAYLRSLRAQLEGDDAEAGAALDVAARGLLDGEAIYYLARTYARIGATERALSQLERAVDAGFTCERPFVTDNWLDDLRDTPRFRHLLATVAARHQRARAVFDEAGGEALLAAPPDLPTHAVP